MNNKGWLDRQLEHAADAVKRWPMYLQIVAGKVGASHWTLKQARHLPEKCQVCGRRYETIYRIPDEVWAKISPKKSPAGLLCIDCADRRAREMGIRLCWMADYMFLEKVSPK